MPESFITILVILLGLIITTSALGCIFWRLLELLTNIAKDLRELIDVIKERPEAKFTATAPSQYLTGSETSPKEIGELPPEIIAPNFTKPPRPAGGFGTRTSQRDDGDS